MWLNVQHCITLHWYKDHGQSYLILCMFRPSLTLKDLTFHFETFCDIRHLISFIIYEKSLGLLHTPSTGKDFSMCAGLCRCARVCASRRTLSSLSSGVSLLIWFRPALRVSFVKLTQTHNGKAIHPHVSHNCTVFKLLTEDKCKP